MSTLPSLSFGALLRRYRQAAGLTQEELAERARLSRDAIDTLERGIRRTPRKATLAFLAEALALTAPERALLEAAARQQGLAAMPTPARDAFLTPPGSPSWPLVGRARELTVLEQHLAGAGPPVLLLAGEPGIGKSRLLVEAAQRAAERGWTVLEGGCQRRSGQEPFAPLVGALERHLRSSSVAQLRRDLESCGWLVRLLPELAETTLVPTPAGTLPPEQERRLMFAAVGRYLANVAGPAGTLLVLDDLQWTGVDALELLVSLVHSPASRVRVVGAYRTTELRPEGPLSGTLADLASAGLVAQLLLGPLARQEATVLLAQVLKGVDIPDAEQVEQVLTRTGGVPFFLVSCAEALRGGTLARESEGVPWTAAQSIRQRVESLPLPAQEVLGAAAVVGRRIERNVLLAVAAQLGQDERATVMALESTRQAGLLGESGEDAYVFPHDLIREVLAADLGAARRAMLHRQVAEAQEAAPGEPALERLAYHYQRAGRLEQAAGYLERAGDRAETLFAHAEAAGYYRELVAVFTQLGRPVPRAQALEKLGGVLKLMGQYTQALEAVEQAITLYRAHDHLEGWGRAAGELMWILATKGASDQDIERFRALLELLETHGPSAQLASLYAGLAMHYMGTIHPDQLPTAQRAVQIARVVGERGSLAFAQAAYGYALHMTGSSQEALQIAEETIPLAQEAGQVFPLWGALHVCMMVHASGGDLATARRYAERAIAVSERQGEGIYLAWMTAYAGDYAYLSGDWEEAETRLTRSLAIARQVGSLRALVVTLPMLGDLRLAQGARQEGHAYLDEVISLVESYHSDRSFLRLGQAMRAEGELVEGQAEAAYQRLAPLCEGRPLDEWGLNFLLPVLAWAQIELGKLEEAEQVLSQGEAYLRARGERLRLVDMLRVRALLETRQERWQEAERTLEEALSLARSMRYPHAEVKVLAVAGQLATQLGQPPLARERWEAALKICAKLGERLYAEQIEVALARLNG